jgi:hypothetical protein
MGEEMMPKRIQRKRTKGWRMPENAVSVTRPGKWGNPFVIGDYYMRGDFRGDVGAFRMIYTSTIAAHADSRYTKITTASEAVEWFRWYMTQVKRDFSELRGKDLACWCKEGAPCHADVLLEIANA